MKENQKRLIYANPETDNRSTTSADMATTDTGMIFDVPVHATAIRDEICSEPSESDYESDTEIYTGNRTPEHVGIQGKYNPILDTLDKEEKEQGLRPSDKRILVNCTIPRALKDPPAIRRWKISQLEFGSGSKWTLDHLNALGARYRDFEDSFAEQFFFFDVVDGHAAKRLCEDTSISTIDLQDNGLDPIYRLAVIFRLLFEDVSQFRARPELQNQDRFERDWTRRTIGINTFMATATLQFYYAMLNVTKVDARVHRKAKKLDLTDDERRIKRTMRLSADSSNEMILAHGCSPESSRALRSAKKLTFSSVQVEEPIHTPELNCHELKSCLKRPNRLLTGSADSEWMLAAEDCSREACTHLLTLIIAAAGARQQLQFVTTDLKLGIALGGRTTTANNDGYLRARLPGEEPLNIPILNLEHKASTTSRGLVNQTRLMARTLAQSIGVIQARNRETEHEYTRHDSAQTVYTISVLGRRAHITKIRFNGEYLRALKHGNLGDRTLFIDRTTSFRLDITTDVHEFVTLVFSLVRNLNMEVEVKGRRV